ncbi:hypothetical protein [Polyangium sp. 6x1]|uniref:hypothetical protein n=1 Tax=Polyangium sp. 6x1 TaxID=3042689 RepID=UPI00248245C0|nr:hypothetical protein [Polyangium sp. 6x1]MDI1448445.1 hypothetical protein [Polyangium sp. 6x1]
MNHVLARAPFAAVSVALVSGLFGCASQKDLAAELVAAATPGHLRPVVACWENEYEASGFQGEYMATVELEISGSEVIESARVTALDPTGESRSESDTGPFRACLEKAFVGIELPSKADADGPGYSSIVGASVRNYKIAFLGDQDERRKTAGGRQAHVLIGPRADRCQGLYVYYPPRDTSALFTEIALGKSRAESARGKDRDQHARELQKTYDLQLELAVRLRADLADASLPPVHRKRLTEALDTARTEARTTGAAIGCKPFEDRR